MSDDDDKVCKFLKIFDGCSYNARYYCREPEIGASKGDNIMNTASCRGDELYPGEEGYCQGYKPKRFRITRNKPRKWVKKARKRI